MRLDFLKKKLLTLLGNSKLREKLNSKETANNSNKVTLFLAPHAKLLIINNVSVQKKFWVILAT